MRRGGEGQHSAGLDRQNFAGLIGTRLPLWCGKILPTKYIENEAYEGEVYSAEIRYINFLIKRMREKILKPLQHYFRCALFSSKISCTSTMSVRVLW
jgi:hypothetical protein